MVQKADNKERIEDLEERCKRLEKAVRRLASLVDEYGNINAVLEGKD